MVRIEEVTKYSDEAKESVIRFLNLLVEREISISEDALKEIIDSTNSHLFFALDDKDNYVGMLTVGTYSSPTGKKAWVEDVVVDEAYRGHGVGIKLTEHAILFSKQQNIPLLMLTSNPTRIAANGLYQKLGFQKRETNVYRMNFSD